MKRGNGQKAKPILYLAQNRQIHKAAAQLGLGLEELRDMAGALAFSRKGSRGPSR